MPALRLDRVGAARATEEGLRLVEEVSPAGFLLFGGASEEIRALTARLEAAAGETLLFASDLERGAGQQFTGAARLPPPAAIGAAARREGPAVGARLAEEAGRITAREARALGVRLLFAPVLDVNTERANPIVNTRAFGETTSLVSDLGAAWIRGALAEGGLPTAKHFPGHGATTADSHRELPVCDLDETAWRTTHLPPFADAIRAGVPAIMTAHISYPRLEGRPGLPATLSPYFLTKILREELGFSGLVVTDAFIMEGLRAGLSETEAAATAVRAGADFILYPTDPAAAARALEEAGVDPARTIERTRRALARTPDPAAARGAREPLADRIARAGVEPMGDVPPPPRGAAVALLAGAGARDLDEARVAIRQVHGGLAEDLPPDDAAAIVYIVSGPAAWAGAVGLSDAVRARLAARTAPTWIVSLGDPYLLDDFPRAHRVRAWGTNPALVRHALVLL